jgi:ABC-2 type transport system ATP-binding protein
LYEVASPAKRATELAVMLGLADRLDARLGSFSRGMKQKVAIARGLVHDPPVLLLDEPATALDPETARSMRTFIVSLRARHRAILLCTHDLDEAQRIADRVVVLYRGRVAREGTTDSLRAVERPTFVVTFDGDEVRANDTNPAVLRALLDDGLRPITLVREERTLEDAYFAIMSQAGKS